MRIILITESIPFPPRNGRELPTGKIFEELCQRHEVDLLVVSTDEQDFQRRLKNLPAGIRNAYFLPYQRLSAMRRIANELTGKKPGYFYRQLDPKGIFRVFTGRQYDFAWINPPGNVEVLELGKQLGLNISRFALLGMNDLKSSLYADKIHQVRGGNFKWSYLLHWLRSFPIARLEKKYLQSFDLIHVQTEKEKAKTLDLLQLPSYKNRVVASPNGVKEFLFNAEYKGIDSRIILFMTHLDGVRKYESQWFLKKVWPRIKATTDARLWLVGSPPAGLISYIHSDARIDVKGFVPDLTEVFNQVRLVVVPIFHGTGLINRIQDAMVAGVPVVASELAASTFPKAKDGKHLLTARTAMEWANEINSLYHNKSLRHELSLNGRVFAKEEPTWKETAQKLERHMEACCNGSIESLVPKPPEEEQDQPQINILNI